MCERERERERVCVYASERAIILELWEQFLVINNAGRMNIQAFQLKQFDRLEVIQNIQK